MISIAALAFGLIFYVSLPPFLCSLCVVLGITSFGKSLGVRRYYVRCLLAIFKFAAKITEEAQAKKERSSSFQLGDEDADEAEDSQYYDYTNKEDEDPFEAYRRDSLKKPASTVINREDNLVLTPNQYPQLHGDNNTQNSGHMPSKNDVSKMSANTFQRAFHLDVVLDYFRTGIGSIIEDEVTQRFVAEELKMWNLLTRTSQSFEFVNVKITIIWIVGFIVRYCILLPGRLLIFIVGLTWLAMGMAFVARLPEGSVKRGLYFRLYTVSFQILGGSISAVITYHNPENKPKRGICVANHTSPIDVMVLSCDNAYASIGQLHSGILGFFQRLMSQSSSHIWFERSEAKDREHVTKRLRDHVDDPTKLPVLVFPEGTCINNTSVMQFKKGSFEVSETVYPVAIKYDPLFGDAFWNSSKNGMASYIYLMMTSWSIVCDVWYLPPMTRRDNENAVDFANRVKAEIAKQGGLVDLMWDGNLKRMAVKTEWKAKQQEAFSKSLKVD